jgi:RNA polymerase sigma-70 factor (ECF subfamily)
LNSDYETASASHSDAELIARAQKGEQEAFEALFHRHKRRVYSLCMRIIGNPADAEDLTQDAFLQVFRKIHTFRGESAFSTWLYMLSLNLVRMRLRKKRLSVTPIDCANEDDRDDPPAEFGAHDPALSGTIARVHLKRAIEQLPPGYRQAFVLHDVEGYQHNEIAAMLGMSIGNSKSQLHKARMTLRKLLGKKSGECGARKNSSPNLNSRRRDSRNRFTLSA